MSWLERVKQDLVIITGDGAEYRPHWVNPSKSVEFNIAQFEFTNLVGSLVKRGLRLGNRYALELIFDEEDHIDIAASFDNSSNHTGVWIVQHPVYGDLKVHPVSILYDNVIPNQTVIKIMVVETIDVDGAMKTKIAPIDMIQSAKATTDQSFLDAFTTSMPKVEAAQEVTLKNNTDSIFKSVVGRIRSGKDKDAFLNAYNKINAQINGPIYDALSTAQSVRELLIMPAQFADSLRMRLNMFKVQFDQLQKTVTNLFSPYSKKIYENNAGLTISSMILSSVTNIADEYKNRVDAFKVMDDLVSYYNLYVESLNSIQTDNGGRPDSYIPDADSVTNLSGLLSMALQNLLAISAKARVERMAILAEDTNIYLVAHQLYGYTGDDSIFDELIETNDIGINELLMLEKGRKIVYYV